MYTIIKANTHPYPWVVLTLRSHTGEDGFWCISDVHAEELILQAYHTTSYEGVVLDALPECGGWIDESDINKL